ncbi:MAG TPA: serine hydrolase [Saprospiraceae bacterium]|nr:serine hydrolase [Saprospiraceae bacterium]
MRIKRIILVILLILLIVAAGVLWLITPIANGYTAKYLCSHTFTSKLDPDIALERFVKPMHVLFRGVVPEIDTTAKTVTVKYLGFLRPRTAVWREGCGCTLLVESTADDLRKQHEGVYINHASIAVDTTNALWPMGNLVNRDSLQYNIDWTAIDHILDREMKGQSKADAKRNTTLALVVAWKGQIIAERYAEGVDENTSLLGWSATKSITGALTGVMVKDHGLDIHAPIGLPEWAGDVRKEITIDHLLRMESGLDLYEDFTPLAKATEMLYGCSDMGVFAAARPPAAGPDRRWVYSSGTSNVLADVLYARVGSTPDALHQLAYDEFFNRLGITTAVFEHDESDAFVGSSYLYMSARDWLRVCKLYMDDGVWYGDRILPEGWVKYSLTPTPNATDACYGAHIWLNAAADPADRQMPGVPADAFMFKGFQSQWIVGIPSKELMVARLGVTHGEERWSPEEVSVGVLGVLEGKVK